MSKFELSLSENYVPSWTVVDAVRELFQNAIDQQVLVEDNEMFFDYDNVSKLQIGNKSSVLDVKSLLLGESTKADNAATIGKFGEGYKIATLVLLRLGKSVTFYNYGAREVWKPRFVKSKRYGGANILTFFVDKKWPWDAVPDNNLTIVVDGITPEEAADIKLSNLHLQQVDKVLIANKGRILLDEQFKGRIYVNGLFVCEHKKYHYGYDIKPRYINIDRDRKLVSDFDLKWLASTLWADVESDLVVELVKQGAADVEYLQEHWCVSTKKVAIRKKAVEDFITEFGHKAVPVTSQYEVDVAKHTYIDAKPIIVTSSHKALIGSVDWAEEAPAGPTLKERFECWLEEHRESLSDNAIDDLIALIREVG